MQSSHKWHSKKTDMRTRCKKNIYFNCVDKFIMFKIYQWFLFNDILTNFKTSGSKKTSALRYSSYVFISEQTRLSNTYNYITYFCICTRSDFCAVINKRFLAHCHRETILFF